MKLKLILAKDLPKEGIEKSTAYYFVSEAGMRFCAIVNADKIDYQTSKRWYDLVCGLITAQKNNQDLWIVTEKDPIFITTANQKEIEIVPPADFKIELTEHVRQYQTPPATENREQYRRDIHE